MRRNLVGIFIISLLVVFIAGEVIGRFFGLTSLSLYQADKDYEYIPKPNQKTRVYRNKYATNEFSMRSEPIHQDDSCTVLLIGDSIIYGGNSTDQDSLASTILERAATTRFRRKVRVLNISAQSWGPDNGAAYIKKHGLFNADLIILVYSSHDAHDNMTFNTKIGPAPYYSKNVLSAWEIIFQKGIAHLTNMFSKKNEQKDLLITNGSKFNTGFAYFSGISKAQGIPVALYLHSEVDELKKANYSSGGVEIISFCRQNNFQLIKGIEREIPDLYDDQIHFNNEGQKLLAKTLLPVIVSNLEKSF